MADHILELVQTFMKVETAESQFLNVIVYKPDSDKEKANSFINNIVTAFGNVQQEGKDNVLRVILQRAANANMQHMRVLMMAMEKLVEHHLITAKLLCDRILLSEKLTYENRNFWIEGFKLVRKVISLVDYKGVRDIMKTCREKAQTFPVDVNINYVAQLQALEETIRFIFDRKNCLLPAYFVANEIMKPQPFHWKFNRLTTDFVEEFRSTAQMVTIIGHTHMLPIVEHYDYADRMVNSWKLDHETLKFHLKGSLPYEPELLEEQTRLVRYVLMQPYSKDMTLAMLGLQKHQKQRCLALEEQLVNLIISAMEMSEPNENSSGGNFNIPLTEEQLTQNTGMWLHISSLLINLVMHSFVNFINIVSALHERLSKLELRRGRDQLMWLLLQYISGMISKNYIQTFLPLLKLMSLLYPEQEPLNLPDCSKSSSLRQMAPLCIWIHLVKKARVENMNINRPIPIALKKHYEYLQHLVQPGAMMPAVFNNHFPILLICNAYSTSQDYFQRPLNILVEALNGNHKDGVGGSSPPFSMAMLDNLTLHSKMSLIHSFVTQTIKQAQTKSAVPSPALVETYARLLVYNEIEALGIKSFLTQLLPTIFKNQAWGILHILLEMFSHRLHHIPTHYRVQLLSHLHSLASVPQSHKMQLNFCFETAALRLITTLGSVEVLSQLSRSFNEKPPNSIASTESEELNRVLVLTLARSIHITMDITGSSEELQPWCKEILSTIMQNTPHSWSSHTLACFPPAISEFFTHNSHPNENKQLLKKAVEEEYRNWQSMANENDIIAHFIRPNMNPLFLCLLFKMIWETENISPVAYKILEGISARALSAHLRKLCDYLVGEVVCSNRVSIHKCVDTINNLIWKYHIFTIDRFLLCLVLRTQEGNDAQVCFFIIQVMLLKSLELRNRIQEFCKENHPDHWKQNNWHEKHLAFHQKYPEKFAPDESASHAPLPIYFGNVCLRFLPVLDIVVHRFIELPIGHQILEIILGHLCTLYKFHDRPITYLYNTLHFYERVLRERPSLKKKLVSAITGAFCDIRPSNWCLSDQYKIFLQSQDLLWNPEFNYYLNLIRRLSETISEKNILFKTDWRFNEFGNAPTHAQYVTCVELLSLPVAPTIVANQLIDAIVKGYSLIPPQEIHSYINALGIIMSALPESYWSVIYDRLQEVLNTPNMLNWNYRCDAFELFNFKTVREAMLDKTYAIILAVAHSIFHHMGSFKLATMTKYIKEKLQPCIRTEQQLVFLCHVFGPFLQRIEQEKSNAVTGIAIILYELLEVVDKHHGPSPLEYMDPICDFLYHIKYFFVGNSIRNESEAIIKRLCPALRMRLRFITHLNVEEIHHDKSKDPSQATQMNSGGGGLLHQHQQQLHHQQHQQQQQQQQQSHISSQHAMHQQPQQPQQQQMNPNMHQQAQLHQMQQQQQQNPNMGIGMSGTGLPQQQQQIQHQHLQQLQQQQFQQLQHQQHMQQQLQHMQQQQNMGMR